MRNYLPFKRQSKSLRARVLRLISGLNRRHYAVISFALVVAAGSVFLWAKLSKAYQTPCTNTYGAEAAGATTNWDSNGYHYIVRSFSTGSSTATDGGTDLFSSQFCGGSSEVVDMGLSGYQYLGQKPVEIRLGVPNQGGGNNQGLWDNPTSGLSAPNYRPPQYARNWASNAVSADDGGAAGIETSRFKVAGNNVTHTIWCWGVGSAQVTADGYQDCDPFGPGNFFQDPSTFPPGSTSTNGAGYFLSQENCHLNDSLALGGKTFPGANGTDYAHDYDSLGNNPYPTGGSAVSCRDPNNWLWYRQTGQPNQKATLMDDAALQLNGSAASCATAPGATNQCMDLTNYIGCATPSGNCNHSTDAINNFTLRQYNRNTVANLSGTRTLLTFKYPIAETVKVTKSPAPPPRYFPAGSHLQYTLKVDRTSRTSSTGLIGDLTVTDTMGPNQAYSSDLGTCAAGTVIPPTSIVGNKLTWTVSSTQIDAINRVGTNSFSICYTVTTPAVIASSPTTVTNGVTVSGHTTVGLDIPSDSANILNYLYTPQIPFLTTTGGDVHAGGIIDPVGISDPSHYPGSSSIYVSCGGAINSHTITGQGSSLGDYVVSAGNITEFGSNGSHTDPSLQAAFYDNICRPPMDALARIDLLAAVRPEGPPGPTAAWVPPTPAPLNANPITATGDLTAVLNGIGSDRAGVIVYCKSGCVISGNVHIHTRLTLIADSGLRVNSAVIVESAPDEGQNQPASTLASFGVITTTVGGGAGNISFSSNTSRDDGYYWARGTIDTCTDNNGVAILSLSSSVNLCRTPLVVYGLLSANQFRFGRLPSTGTTASETINYQGALFVAPPPIFDSIFGVRASVSSQGEVPPRY